LPVVQLVTPHVSASSMAAATPIPEAVRITTAARATTVPSAVISSDGATAAPIAGDQVPGMGVMVAPAAQKDTTAMGGLTTGAGLLLLWLTAVLVQLARLGMALRCNVVLKRSGFAPDEETAARWNHLLRSTEDVKRPVRLALSSFITMPAVVGYRRPVVLLPDSLATRLDGEELDGILLHELAHVRRRDDWAIAVQRFLQALFALHPLVHLIASKMELQREIACDDWVLRTQQVQVYARSLTSVAEYCLRPAHSGLMGLAMERPSQLGQRVELLLDSSRPVMTRISLRWLGGLASALGLVGLFSLQLPEVMAFPVQASVAPATKSSATAKPVSVTVAPMNVDAQVKVSPNVTLHIAAAPVSVVAPVHVATAVRVDPDGSVEELAREQAELSKEQRALGEKQGELVRQQMDLARQKIEAHQQEIQKQLREQLEPQMRRLQAQLSHLDSNHMVNDAVRAQIRAGELEAEMAISQAMSELSRKGLAGKEGRLTPEQMNKLRAERDRYQAQAAQLRTQQERAAKEFGDRISAIVNETVNRALSDTK
jgi:beta-lactamase regulating signal transducer with metallopeptidase domain